MKKKLFAALTAGMMLCGMLTAPVSAAPYENESAVITELNDYTSETELTDNGTIITRLISTVDPHVKYVNYITEDQSDFHHREYKRSFLITVKPKNTAAFVKEFGEQYYLHKQPDDTYVVADKEMENAWKDIQDVLNVGSTYRSSWKYADADAAFKKICASDTVDSAAIQQSYDEYSYLNGSYCLNLFVKEPVKESNFTFLDKGYSVEIDRDEKYPSVELIRSGKPVTDYSEKYNFFRSILRELPEVYSFDLNYWYLQFDSARIGYDTIQTYNVYTSGDVNMDGVVDIADAQLIQQEYTDFLCSNKYSFTPEQLQLSSITGITTKGVHDGVEIPFSVADAQVVFSYATDVISELSVPDTVDVYYAQMF